MPLIGPKEMFAAAYAGRYAVGAFNVNNMEIVQGIMQAASEEKSPVILQVSSGARSYAGQKYLMKLVEAALAEDPSVPVVVHLDHGSSFELCRDCIDGGFTSVMIDGSHLPYEENIALTKQVVEYAHPRGIWVEAELGKLAGVEEHVSNADHVYTDPDQAVDFVERTGCDSLAVAIGTSHGAYSSRAKPSWTSNAWKRSASACPAIRWCCTAPPACPRNSWKPATSSAARWAAPAACRKTCCARLPAWACARSMWIPTSVWP